MHEFLGIRFLALALEDFVEPGELGQVLAVDAAVFLVEPVGGNAVLGLPVHLLGADLHLDPLAVRANDRSVQALVAIGLGHGDVVLETAVHGLPLLVHKTEHRIAVLDVLDDDPEGHDVVHFVKGQGLGQHLLVDAVLVLDAAVDLATNAVAGQEVLEHGDHVLDDALFHHLMVFQPVDDHVVDVRAQILEAQVFQAAHDDIEAQPVGQGRVDVHGLLGYALLLVGLLEVQGAHVVEAVRKLHHDDAHVVAHGQNHLADVFGLGLFLVVKGNAADLGHAINNVRHFIAEVVGNGVNVHPCVFHGVVQKTGGNGRLVKAHVGQGVCHGQGMGKIGFPGKAGLSGMSSGSKDVGPLNKLQIGFLVL